MILESLPWQWIRCLYLILNHETDQAYSDDLYADLRSSLLERVQDKEAPIRIQAVIALSKLQKGEETIEMGPDEVRVVEILAEVLQLDLSA